MPRIQCAVVIPAYNEEECILDVLKDWKRHLSTLFAKDAFEIIVVNDGSKDKTGKVLDDARAGFPELVVVHQTNGGHGKAVLTGYAEALKRDADWVFQVDSDDQFIAADFQRLWKARDQSSFILGRRKNRKDPLHRLVLTRFLRLWIAILTFRSIPDSNIPFRLIRGNYLKRLLRHVPQDAVTPNIFIACLAAADGMNLLNIPVTHRERETGVISIMGSRLIRICKTAMKQLLALPGLIRAMRSESRDLAPSALSPSHA